MFAASWLPLLSLVLFSFHHAEALSLNARSGSLTTRANACSSIKQRVNWFALTEDQQKSYTDAVKCLQTKPQQSGIEASKNLYDDFVAIHIQNSPIIHFVAVFLPWHRRFVQAREKALQSCSYTGPTPYWDWTKAADTGKPQDDPIYAVQGGFGGDGDASQGQNVTQGPFAFFPLNLREGHHNTPVDSPHLLQRNFNNDPALFDNFNSTAWNEAFTYSTFNDFRYFVEGTPHGAVHQYIGADMVPSSSPNDPLFFLHHAQIDRLWAMWQDEDPAKRLTDFAGNRPGANDKKGPFDATINDILPSFGNLIDQVAVRDVMDTRAGDLCYEVSSAQD